MASELNLLERMHAPSHWFSLGADSTGHRRQDIVLADLGCSFEVFAFQYQVDEFTNLDTHGAPLHALRVVAGKATLGFSFSDRRIKAEVDLGEVVRAFGGILFRHLLPLNLGSFFGREALGHVCFTTAHCRFDC